MSEVTLIAKPGREPGSRPSGRLRAVGQIPAVVYGHGITPLPVTVDWRELRAALTTDAGANALINLEIGLDKHLAVVRDMQRHAIRHDVQHIDFQVVSRDEVIAMDVPIVLVGESDSINKTDGATVDQAMHTLAIKSKPGNIPNEISIDISGLEVGGAIRVSDLTMPSGVETELDPDEVVVSVLMIQVDLPEDAEAIEGDAAEGDAADGEGGAGEAEAEGSEG